MDEISLNKLPDFPSYESCIKSYGRSILPPVILSPEREKLEYFRAKAVATEARLTTRKQEGNEFMTLVQKLADVFMGSKEISAADYFSVLEDNQQSAENTASFLTSNPSVCDTKTFRTGIYYEEIIDDDNENSPNLVISDPEKENSNALSVESKHIEKKCLFNENNTSDASWVTTDSEVLEEKNQSDTECSASRVTVILKIDSRSDDESVVTSIDRSTDLDKYLDSSFDAGRMSESPAANEEKKESYQNLESVASGSTITLVDSSHSSTPVVLSNIENDIGDKNDFCIFENITQLDSKNCNVSKLNLPSTENGAFVIETNDCILPGKNKDNTVETKSQKSWLKKILDKAQAVPKAEVKGVSKSDGDADTSTAAAFRPHHVRSNSYTLDSPSPCLALSHAGCRCENSPESIISPHCSSLLSDTDPAEIENKKSENCQLSKKQNDALVQIDEDNVEGEPPMPCITVEMITQQVNSVSNDIKDIDIIDKMSNETVFLASKGSTESSNSCEIVSNEIGKQSTFENQCEMSIRGLYKKFVAMREKTFDNLHSEHLKQWKELSEDFEKQEKKFLERLTFIEFSLSKSSKSPPADPSDNAVVTSVNVHQPANISQHSIAMPISAVRTYIANNNNPTSKDQSIESTVPDLNDPCLQKKFEKVSAAVKGYLTRRLWKSDVVQAIITSLKDCACRVAEIKYEVTKRGGTPTELDLKKHRDIFNKVLRIDTELHDIFFNMNMKDRMKIISDFRESNKHKLETTTQTFVSLPFGETQILKPFGETQILKDRPAVPFNKRKLSSATIKALERKQMGSGTQNKSQSIPDLHVSKKPLTARCRRRILSPRSCTVSPPHSRNFLKPNSPGKKSAGLNKVKARRSLY